MTTENTILKETHGFVPCYMIDSDEAWEVVKDAVDYPVVITNAYYKDDDSDEYVNANGKTNTARDKYFNLVVVDQFRNGDRQVISAVSGKYGTIQTRAVYETLHHQLNISEVKHKVCNLFVTGNGGGQQLTIEINDKMNMEGLPDELVMRVRLDTSVDGSKAHTLSMIAHNKSGDISAHVYGGDYKLSARHTTTISDRTVNFVPAISDMIEQWDDVIIPTMQLMYDNEFNRNVALDLVAGMAEKAGMGERHIVKLTELYESNAVSTKAEKDSLYRVNAVLNQYVEEELEGKQELQNRFKDGIAKALSDQIKKLKKK